MAIDENQAWIVQRTLHAETTEERYADYKSAKRAFDATAELELFILAMWKEEDVSSCRDHRLTKSSPTKGDSHG